jgi:Thiamine pyrophosphate enzyme, C-terminal TPP binding domain
MWGRLTRSRLSDHQSNLNFQFARHPFSGDVSFGLGEARHLPFPTLRAAGVFCRTAAHHRIPLLTIMHNNRAYHQEMMYLQDMANRAQRRPDQAQIGTAMTNPNIDYALLAKAYGMYSAGPIDNPNDLGPAVKSAIEVVKRGEPALIDVVTQPR